MDFKKILATFLVVFVAIDVFLAFQWFQIHQPTANPTATESILSEMKSDGIQVGNLPILKQVPILVAKTVTTF